MTKQAGDDSLGEYAGKRDFDSTPEPAAKPSEYRREEGPGVFVVQKHAARALHYDLRLELHGVLKSWAVPKGPSLYPEDKRLAVHVEDHPIEYAGFEGIIPKGEYGGGTVLLWDRGFWVPEGDPDSGLKKGALKFILSGKKLRGRWALVKLHEEEKGAEEKDEWLLIKERDEDARDDKGSPITDDEPESVASGRKIEEVASRPEGLWAVRDGLTSILPESPRFSKIPMPELVLPQLATLVDEPPEGDEWLHEIKYDGYRVLARVKDGNAALYTRNGNDWTGKFPAIAEAVSSLPVKEAWIDGEIVAFKADGTTSFEGLQSALSAGSGTGLVYMIFDIVHYNRYSLMEAPLSERKRLVRALLQTKEAQRKELRFSGHVEGKGPAFFKNACAYRLEGMVSKKRDSPYRQGRTKDWVKIKCLKRQEFVIGGFTEPGGGRKGFGALLLGVHDCARKLIYCGRVGTGFDESSLDLLWERLKGLEQNEPPFDNPPEGGDAKGVRWVRPELVAEVEFTQWTKEGVLRHPSFQGLREDKDAKEIAREGTESLNEALKPPVKPPAPLRITNPDRVFYPEGGFTKRDLLDYYDLIAPLMLPHLAGRPLTLVRCPEGYAKGCFFQKHTDGSIPEHIKRIGLKENNGEGAEYLMVDAPDGILSLVQLGVLEIHTWNSRYMKLEYPDRMVFDMDPGPSVEWQKLAESAVLLRELLKELGLTSFVKTTGGNGLHVVAPLIPSRDWEEVKAFTKAVAEYLAAGVPERFTSMMTRSRRTGKIFLDYMRNLRGATAIELYSTRAKKGAPIAVPLYWDEIVSIRSDTFTLANIRDRVKDVKNPWARFMDVRQSITDGMMKRVGVL